MKRPPINSPTFTRRNRQFPRAADSSGPRRFDSATWGVRATKENAHDPLSARCPVSATKRATLSCRQRRPRPDVEPFASKDCLQNYFSLQSIFNVSEFMQFNKNSFLASKKKKKKIAYKLQHFVSLSSQ